MWTHVSLRLVRSVFPLMLDNAKESICNGNLCTHRSCLQHSLRRTKWMEPQYPGGKWNQNWTESDVAWFADISRNAPLYFFTWRYNVFKLFMYVLLLNSIARRERERGERELLHVVNMLGDTCAMATVQFAVVLSAYPWCHNGFLGQSAAWFWDSVNRMNFKSSIYLVVECEASPAKLTGCHGAVYSPH